MRLCRARWNDRSTDDVADDRKGSRDKIDRTEVDLGKDNWLVNPQLIVLD